MSAPERIIEAGGVVFACERLLGRAEWVPVWETAALAASLGPALITGGAGSIGGTLAARLAALGVPVCIADANEAALDLLERDLPPGDGVTYRLCDVGDSVQVQRALSSFAPRTIFHLAAKKHVKYAEHAARNAVLSNVLGTWNVLDAARKHGGVKNVVCASSDKAVAAKNLLGRTKRAAERITSSFAAAWGEGKASSVRLCNVLGTAGNVLEHYVDEAKRGVVLDVWSRDMTRFFCSVHEAVDLFLHAAARPGAPVYTLDPGPATPIVDFASRVCAVLAEHGIPANAEVTERFGAMHARHEELWTRDETVHHHAHAPAPVSITCPVPQLEVVEPLLRQAGAAPLDDSAMLEWLSGVESMLQA